MVILSTEFCTRCGCETTHHNRSCVTCLETLRKARIAAWNEQTIAQRLNNLRERVEQLEAGPPTF